MGESGKGNASIQQMNDKASDKGVGLLSKEKKKQKKKYKIYLFIILIK